jgi:hypothetical protein
LQGESGKNRVLVEIALSSIEKPTLGVAPLPNRHCGISEVPISSFDVAAVGTAHEGRERRKNVDHEPLDSRRLI